MIKQRAATSPRIEIRVLCTTDCQVSEYDLSTVVRADKARYGQVCKNVLNGYKRLNDMDDAPYYTLRSAPGLNADEHRLSVALRLPGVYVSQHAPVDTVTPDSVLVNVYRQNTDLRIFRRSPPTCMRPTSNPQAPVLLLAPPLEHRVVCTMLEFGC